MTANIKSPAAQPFVPAINAKLSLLRFNLHLLSSWKKKTFLKKPNRYFNQQLYFISTMTLQKNMPSIEFCKNVVRCS